MESKRTATTYFIPPGKFLLLENALGNPDLIQSSVSSDCRVTIVDKANFPLDDLEQWPTFRLTASDILLNLGANLYYIYIVVPTPDNTESTSAFIAYNTALVDRDGYEVLDSVDEEGNPIKVKGDLLGKSGFKYYQCGTVSSRGVNTSATTTPQGQGRLIEMDLGVTPSPSTLPGDLNDFDKIFKVDKMDESNPKSWLLTILIVVKEMTARLVRITDRLIFGKDNREKQITDIKRSIDSDYEFLTDEKGNVLKDENGNPIPNPDYVPVSDETIPTTAWVSEKFSEISEDKYIRKDQPDRTPHDLAVGGVLSAETSILLQDKQISGFIRYYDEPRPEVVTDVDVYSALMTEARIEDQFKSVDDRYIRKDKEDTALKHITFEEGVTVYQLAKMMDLEVSELATIARAIVDILGSAKFVDGFAGEGYRVWKSIATGDWCFTIDRLTVRKVMTIYELIIQKIRSVGGMIVVSAGNGKIKEVTEEGLEYRISFEDTNTFTENDLMRCQVWTGTGVKYYWVEVVRVADDCVYARKADFAGVVPEAGDEVVLMGNTKNKLRQSLLLLSATEDGQPRFDCLDGIHDKNFGGCLRTRVGSLDGINDEQFPAGLQPQGYGLYADNCYLRGVFVLSTGVDVQTQFSIMEGQIRASLSSVQQQINAEDNYLSNASFTADMDKWQYANDVRAYATSGGLLFLNDNLYTEKKKFAGIVVEQDKNVLQIINGYIVQKYEDYAMYPDFSEVEQTATDEEGNEVGTGVMLYRPRMFYASFKCMVAQRGVLKIYFEGEETRDDFEEYEPLYCEKELDESLVFETFEWAGKWNGTGNFRLEFTGEMFLYDLALSDDKLSDLEERWSSRLEITEKKMQAEFEQTNGKLEEYRSEFQLTAEALETSFDSKLADQYTTISKEYHAVIRVTSDTLSSDYTNLIKDSESKTETSYKSLVSQTAESIRTELTADMEDMEAGVTSAYTTAIETRAGQITASLEGQITDLKNGDIASMKTSIKANAEGLATKVSQTDFNALNQAVVKNETAIGQTQSDITLLATKQEVNAMGERINAAEASIKVNAEDIALRVKSSDYNGNNIISYINQTATTVTINASKIDLVGQVTFNDLGSEVQSTINGKVSESTIISGGFIKTSLINADELVVRKFQATSSGYTYLLDSNGFKITNSEGAVLSRLYVSDNLGYLRMAKDSVYSMLSATDVMFYSSQGLSSLSGAGLQLLSGAQIRGLAIGNMTSSPYVLSDFVLADSNINLPEPSNCPGKVMFVKTTKGITISGSIISWSGSSISSSVTADGAWALIFISNGSYWYGFNCH